LIVRWRAEETGVLLNRELDLGRVLRGR
jgi:hypothetical protein